MKRQLPNAGNCDDFHRSSLTRRGLFRVGGLGLLGLHWPGLLQAREQTANRPARAKAIIFLHQFGGPSQTDTVDMKPNAPEAIRGEGAVLFWEDIGEETYRLDRMLTQLERSGTFDGLQAMVIGSVAPGRRGVESEEDVRAWLRLRFVSAPFPVVMGFPAGHLDSTRTIPLGVHVRVAVGTEGGRIEFPEAAVE